MNPAAGRLDTARSDADSRLAPARNAAAGPEWASRQILGMRVDPSTYPRAVDAIIGWASRRESRVVCVANVHMVMEAYDDPGFQEIVNSADLVTSDGMPLVWALRTKGCSGAERVYGPDLTPAVCAGAAEAGLAVGFLGGSEEALAEMSIRLSERFPGMRIAYAHSPPFRPLSAEEEAAIVKEINDSGIAILFVGLGCPKQERWMARHRGAVSCVSLGVGAAFDLIGGRRRMAPGFMQRLGLEWLFRLFQEPRRLWRRYLWHNPRFLVLMALDLLRPAPGRSVARAVAPGDRR